MRHHRLATDGLQRLHITNGISLSHSRQLKHIKIETKELDYTSISPKHRHQQYRCKRHVNDEHRSHWASNGSRLLGVYGASPSPWKSVEVSI